VRVLISDKTLLRDLLLYLRECGGVAEQASADEIEVFLPAVPHDLAARMELSVYLTAWRVRNPSATAEIVD
jgi:hypothetical protein